MNVFWTEHASHELRAIHDYIAADSARYAHGMIDRIIRKSQHLANFPLLGAVVPEYGDDSIRELFEHPYRIIYLVRPERVEVVAVVHAARELPKPSDGS